MNRIKLQKLLFCLFRPKLYQALIKRIAPSIEHTKALRDLKPDLIIDVGANKGQFSIFSRLHFPNAQIIAFEPMQQAIDIISSLDILRDNYTLYPCAAGNKKGSTHINISNADDSSSILEIGSLQTKLFPGTQAVATEEIQMDLIDNLLSFENDSRQTLLKIDVQGSELLTLQGAKESLRHIQYIYVELSFVELYIEQALASEVIHFLHEQEFIIKDIANISRDNKGKIIQADFLFAKF